MIWIVGNDDNKKCPYVIVINDNESYSARLLLAWVGASFSPPKNANIVVVVSDVRF